VIYFLFIFLFVFCLTVLTVLTAVLCFCFLYLRVYIFHHRVLSGFVVDRPHFHSTLRQMDPPRGGAAQSEASGGERGTLSDDNSIWSCNVESVPSLSRTQSSDAQALLLELQTRNLDALDTNSLQSYALTSSSLPVSQTTGDTNARQIHRPTEYARVQLRRDSLQAMNRSRSISLASSDCERLEAQLSGNSGLPVLTTSQPSLTEPAPDPVTAPSAHHAVPERSQHGSNFHRAASKRGSPPENHHHASRGQPRRVGQRRREAITDDAPAMRFKDCQVLLAAVVHHARGHFSAVTDPALLEAFVEDIYRSSVDVMAEDSYFIEEILHAI
jgi:hypothetical protein